MIGIVLRTIENGSRGSSFVAGERAVYPKERTTASSAPADAQRVAAHLETCDSSRANCAACRSHSVAVILQLAWWLPSLPTNVKQCANSARVHEAPRAGLPTVPSHSKRCRTHSVPPVGCVVQNQPGPGGIAAVFALRAPHAAELASRVSANARAVSMSRRPRVSLATIAVDSRDARVRALRDRRGRLPQGAIDVVTNSGRDEKRFGLRT